MVLSLLVVVMVRYEVEVYTKLTLDLHI